MGVPAIDQGVILSADMQFPDIGMPQRIVPRSEERSLLECVVRLMIEKGICFDHQGLLIFPSLLKDMAIRGEGGLLSAPVHYDFNGRIDDLFASLVCRLGVSRKFGSVRLWSEYAEFGDPSGRTFALRHRELPENRGRLEVSFDQSTTASQRSLFHAFVRSDLENRGVKITQGLGFSCRKCSRPIEPADINYRLEHGENEIQCPRCQTSHPIFAPPDAAIESERRQLVALKSEVVEKTRSSGQQVTNSMAQPRHVKQDRPLRILHLSDLHFTGSLHIDSVFQPLRADLRDSLGIDSLDYLIISGDFTHRGSPDGFDRALDFMRQLLQSFRISPLQTILTPGNHDIEDSENVSTLRSGAKGKRMWMVIGMEP